MVRHKPHLLSDNGSCYISGDLATWLTDQKRTTSAGCHSINKPNAKSPLVHCCAVPCRTVERWHQTVKNRVLLKNYYLPGNLERKIGAFVDYYNYQRYYESLKNVTPAEVYLDGTRPF